MTAHVGPLAGPASFEAWATGPHARDLDPAMLVTANGNRWSSEREPTIYVSNDPGVALAEYGRNRRRLASLTAVWAVGVRLEHAVDLRDASSRTALGLPDDGSWLLDGERCRRLAGSLRAKGRYDGMLVPSVACLDQPDRWNAVIFVDRLRADLQDAVLVRRQAGALLGSDDRDPVFAAAAPA